MKPTVVFKTVVLIVFAPDGYILYRIVKNIVTYYFALVKIVSSLKAL